MDMWIPFEVPAESMQDHNEAGGKVFGFVRCFRLRKYVDGGYKPFLRNGL